ncbi:hypothetical protein C2G38_2151412 [Gigaspora rosea]|uniref:Uncharacterized protein n=1 Tax=Gigaspora rosea TaxID=44941 RepID=A0A397W842_9GLOM|nr:hypothetical protein C2G38_2151412 [Gigaspora rosea]
MSTLNLGLQGVALKHNLMSSESETLFQTANTLDDIYKKTHEYIKLESELKESIAEDITEIFESIFRIDLTLKIEETTQTQISHYLELVKFIDTHCQAGAYSFQCKAIFVHTQINCDSPIKILYYSSCKEENHSICYYCRNHDNLVTPSQSLKEHFKQIYPLCEFCQENKKNFHMKGAIKTNKK